MLERLFRRAGLPLRLSAGFHPKPRMSFPSALALGIEGTDEVMEVELPSPFNARVACGTTAAPQAPGFDRGFRPNRSPTLPQRRALPWPCTRSPMPADRCPALQQAIDRLLAQPRHLVPRPGRSSPVDLPATWRS